MKRILLLLALLGCAASAFAQTSTITALPAGGALTGTEPIPMDQVGCATPATCKTTPAAINTYIEAHIALTSAQILSAFTGTCSSATFLRGDGACAAPGGGGGSPGGADTNVQYNASGAFLGDADFAWTYGATNNFLTLTTVRAQTLPLLRVASPGGLGGITMLFDDTAAGAGALRLAEHSGIFYIGASDTNGNDDGDGLVITNGGGFVQNSTLEAQAKSLGINNTGAVTLNGSTGTSGQVLTSGGSGAATWSAVAPPSGTPAFIGAGGAPSSLGSWSSTTLGVQMLGAHIVNAMPSFKFSLDASVAGLIVNAAVMRRTLRNSATYIDSTPITWASSGTPTFGAGIQVSDTIAVAIDNAHDYYILIYFDPTTAGSAAMNTWSDPRSGIWGNYASGNVTAATTTAGFTFSNSAMGVYSVTSP
jgi:hypothetical protein